MRKQKVVNLLKEIKWLHLEEELRKRYPEELEDAEDYKKVLWELYEAEELEMEEQIKFDIEIFKGDEFEEEYTEDELYYEDFNTLIDYEKEDYIWIKNSIVEFVKTEGVEEEEYTDTHLLLLLLTEIIYGDVLSLIREKRNK